MILEDPRFVTFYFNLVLTWNTYQMCLAYGKAYENDSLFLRKTPAELGYPER